MAGCEARLSRDEIDMGALELRLASGIGRGSLARRPGHRRRGRGPGMGSRAAVQIRHHGISQDRRACDRLRNSFLAPWTPRGGSSADHFLPQLCPMARADAIAFPLLMNQPITRRIAEFRTDDPERFGRDEARLAE